MCTSTSMLCEAASTEIYMGLNWVTGTLHSVVLFSTHIVFITELTFKKAQLTCVFISGVFWGG